MVKDYYSLWLGKQMLTDTFIYFMYSFVTSIIIITIGAIILNFISNRLKISYSRIFILFLWHYCFVFIAQYYSIKFVSDSLSYYEEAIFGNILLDQTLAVKSIVFVNIILNQYLCLNYLGVYLFYGYLGFIGILFLESLLNYYFKEEDKESLK